MSDQKPPRMPRILSLDIAHKLGWCDGAINDRPVYGSLYLGGRQADIIDRCVALEDWLADRLTFRPDVLAIEAPIPLAAMGGMATEAVVFATLGMSLVARIQAQRSGMPTSRVQLFKPQDIRHHYVGVRTFKVKDDGKRACALKSREIGWAVTDYDASDAIALWDMACARVAPNVYARGHSAKFTGRMPSEFCPSIAKGKPPSSNNGPLFKERK